MIDAILDPRFWLCVAVFAVPGLVCFLFGWSIATRRERRRFDRLIAGYAREWERLRPSVFGAILDDFAREKTIRSFDEAEKVWESLPQLCINDQPIPGIHSISVESGVKP